MAKPVLTHLVHGQQGWDADANDNYDKLTLAPFPLYELDGTGGTPLPAAALFDRCALNYKTTAEGWNTYVSDGAKWIKLLRSDQVDNENPTNGQKTSIAQATTTLVLAGASVTAVNLIPAGCILLGVTTRMINAGGGPASMNIGDAVTANLYAAAVPITLNATTDLRNHIAAAVNKLFTVAGSVVIRSTGVNFTGGGVRVTAHYSQLTAPTS